MERKQKNRCAHVLDQCTICFLDSVIGHFVINAFFIFFLLSFNVLSAPQTDKVHSLLYIFVLHFIPLFFQIQSAPLWSMPKRVSSHIVHMWKNVKLMIHISSYVSLYVDKTTILLCECKNVINTLKIYLNGNRTGCLLTHWKIIYKIS